MATFQKNLQKFFVYFFTSVSVLVVVLGIQRAKQGDALGLTPAPEGTSGGDTGFTSKFISKLASGGSTQTVTATGKTYQTPWGNLATTVKVKNGKVVAVEIPKLPDSPPSIYAEPFLIDQALRSGSADIQGVSGATITSNAFKASLESALAQAASQGASVTEAPALTRNTVTPPPAPPPAPSITVPTITKQTVTQPAIQTVGTTGISGTFTGSAYQTPWGNAVASVTFTNGKITAVSMPQVPNSPPSIQAKPYLIAQALAAGSANIQGVSGATYASIAFKSSLENAIAQASAQGTVATPSPSATVSSPSQTVKPSVSRTYHDDDWDDDDDDDDDEWDD